MHHLNDSFGDGKDTYTSSLGYYCGDNPMHAAQHLIGWQGVAKESDYPYPPPSINYSLPESARYDSVAHLQSYMTIPKNITAIKKAILEYGSISVSYYDDDNFYSNQNAYFQNQYTTQNHAVTIVGWDDSYALSNFDGLKNKPSSPGAWKIKNSWGPVWGNDGYFWLSYEDTSLAYFTVFDAEAADNYHILHQYDGADASYYLSGDAAANIFTVPENQSLKAVGFYTHENYLDYEIKIYKLNKSYNTPTDGNLISTVSGSTSYKGYHTVKLDKSIPLKKGDVFSVVVELSNGYYPFEGPNASSKPNESFILRSGKWYTEITSNNITANNACIKAYSCRENFTVSFNSNGGADIQAIETPSGSLLDIPPSPQKENSYFSGWYKDAVLTKEWNFETDTVTENTTLYAKWSDTPISVESITLSAEKNDIYVNEKLKISAKIIPYYATNTNLLWTCSDKSISISDGEISSNKKGSYIITATSRDATEVSANFTVNIHEPIKNFLVQTEKPVYKTADKIIYRILAENAISYDFYIETPDGRRLILANAPSIFSLNYTYTEGQYKFYVTAYDALGNSITSAKKTFWVTNNPMLIVQKTDNGFRVGGYNSENTKLFAAYYTGNQLISILPINESNKLFEIDNNINSTKLKVIWLNSLNNMIPVTEHISIENPGTVPVATTFTAQ